MGTAIDLHSFHEVELPARLESGNGVLAGADALPLGPISLVSASGSWTYVPANGSVSVVDGVLDSSRVVVELDDQSFTDLVADLDTPPAMLYQQRATVSRGNPLRFIRWEPALRAMFHGRPIYDAAAVDLRDRSGASLEPSATFDMAAVAADPGAVAHQLSTAGFVVVRTATKSMV